MFDIKNTYWNNNGKHQDLVNELTDRTPGHGFTSNVYANIYLVMANLYYDVYNNGGGNIEDCYAKDFYNRVEPYLGDKVDIKAFLNENHAKMEDMVNIAFEFIKDKNLEFPIYSFWCNHEAQMISEHKPEGDVAEKGYWFDLTFGEPEEMDKYKTSWCSKYQDVSEEVIKATEKDVIDKKYYEIDLCNFDENNVPISIGTVYCIAQKELSKEEATEFCREELGMDFEEVFSISEASKEDALEYYDSDSVIPVYEDYGEKKPLDKIILTCENMCKEGKTRDCKEKDSIDKLER